MGYKQTARAQHKNKELEKEIGELHERITNLIAALENQKVIYKNVVKAIVLQCGKLDFDAYTLIIPEDLANMNEWTIEASPDEETGRLHIRVKPIEPPDEVN